MSVKISLYSVDCVIMEFCIQKELGEKSMWIVMEPDTLMS